MRSGLRSHAKILIVNSNDKKRFSLSDDGERIRAAQGHSVAIELGLPATRPPPTLYHGTAMRFANLILLEGLKSQARQQVHLTDDPATARRVGQRHGKPVVLEIQSLRLHAKGFKYFRADNGAWLTDHVPPEFLSILLSRTAESAMTSRQPKLST